jgi:hypothetical protein
MHGSNMPRQGRQWHGRGGRSGAQRSGQPTSGGPVIALFYKAVQQGRRPRGAPRPASRRNRRLSTAGTTPRAQGLVGVSRGLVSSRNRRQHTHSALARNAAGSMKGAWRSTAIRKTDLWRGSPGQRGLVERRVGSGRVGSVAGAASPAVAVRGPQAERAEPGVLLVGPRREAAHQRQRRAQHLLRRDGARGEAARRPAAAGDRDRRE